MIVEHDEQVTDLFKFDEEYHRLFYEPSQGVDEADLEQYAGNYITLIKLIDEKDNQYVYEMQTSINLP